MNSWHAEFGDAYLGQRVLVTGACGFVGGHLTDALLALGAEVSVLDSQETGGPSSRESYVVDLKDLDAVAGALTQARPEVVFHLAGLVTARQEMDLVRPMLFNNLLGTVHLMLVLAEVGCQHLLVLSSSEERSDEAPSSPYAASKAAARLYAGLFQQTYGLPVTVGRLFMAYGPRQRPDKLIPYIVLSLLQGKSPHLSSGGRICDFIHIQDVIRGLLALGLRSDLAGQTVDLGTGRGVSIREAALLTAELTGGKVQPLFGALSDRTGERPQLANESHTQAVLGWTPSVNLEEGLKNTIDWYRRTI